MARVALCNCECDPLDAVPPPTPEEGPSPDGSVPPAPDASLGIKIHGPRPAEKQIETATFVGKRAGGTSSTSAESPVTSGHSDRPGHTVVKQYDQSFKQPDIIVKTSDVSTKTGRQGVKVADSKVGNTTAREPAGPRIRWERSAVSVYRFETKSEAVAAMDFIRRKALGEDPQLPPNVNLKHVTTREVGWTRPQDFRSPELAQILFELPVGQVSAVIEVGETLMVCRVLEREPHMSAANVQVLDEAYETSDEEHEE